MPNRYRDVKVVIKKKLAQIYLYTGCTKFCIYEK